MRLISQLLVLAVAACQGATAPPERKEPTPGPERARGQWSAPAALFDASARIAAGDRLHALGLGAGGALLHRSSGDEGATWDQPTPIPGAGSVLPLYGPLAVEGMTVHVLTREGATIRMQRSVDGGATWSAPAALAGYTATGSERVQVDTDGDHVHVFLGVAGAVPDATFRIYYWRSADRGATWSGVRILDDASGPPSPGGIAVENGTAHVAYAAILPGAGTLGHRARYLRSTDGGVTWSAPVDVSGGSDSPQIRPRPRVVNGRVLVLWEESLDHDPARPYPNATRGQIRANRSLDGGVTWEGTFDVTAVSGAYPNHPEIAVGPGSLVHVAYRISRDQATLSSTDSIGYLLSTDFGATWSPAETALDMPGVDTHLYNTVATRNYVHLMAGGSRFYHVRRTLPEAP